MTMHLVEITSTLWFAVDLNRRVPDAEAVRQCGARIREDGLMVGRIRAGEVR